jgi:hypothetical protein
LGEVSSVDPATLTSSWHEGCPVAIEDLRILRLSYWGLDHATHRGALIVAARYARPVVGVFRRLYRARFPIVRMEPVEAFDGDDDRSMSADNTSGFDCRAATGSNAWSQHAYGAAIDVDPVENPYVDGDTVLPPQGGEYLDRSDARPGMIGSDGVVVRAFAAIGWSWGGAYRSLKDYQHFSATGA